MTYVPVHPPRAKQAEALKLMEERTEFALLMGMRTGKTKVILDKFGDLETRCRAQDLLVIGPAGALPPWQGQIVEHMEPAFRKRLNVFVWRSGAGALYQRMLKRFLEDDQGPRAFFVNIEALSSVKAARDAVLDFIRTDSGRRVMGVVDEATVIKGHKAARTKFVLDQIAPHCAYRYILSGLISPKDPLDVFCPFWFLDWRILGHRSYYTFRARYAVIAQEWYGDPPRKIDIVVGFKNLEELQARIAAASFRCTLDDMYDAPAKLYMKREIEHTPEQARIYGEMLTAATAKVREGDHVTATVVIAQMGKLHQINCGFARTEDGRWVDIPENRTASLMEALAETDEKAIIWCAYDRQLQKIVSALKESYGEASVARFWGGNLGTREAEEKRFKSEDACRFMVATQAAGGRGREWSVADFNIYASNTYNLEHRDQSEERPRAEGKMRPITYLDLMVPDTVDETIIEALREKIDLAAVINGDNWREWLV